MKKWITTFLLCSSFAFPMQAFADAAVGDTVVTLGANLNETQKNAVLAYFKPPKNTQYLTVTIDEERRYLGGKVPDSQIGNGTHSCAMVTYTKKGSGIHVQTEHINYVTDSAYASALTTAGVSDADVKVTAPFDVSGTGALTGILKAYEQSSGTVVSDAVKEAATQEMVTNTNLAQSVGEKNATQIVTDVKEAIAKEGKPKTAEEVRDLANKVLKDNGITLTDAQYNDLLKLIEEFSKLDINWKKVAEEATKIAGQAQDYLNSEEGQNFLSQLGDWLNHFVDWLRDVFGNNAESSAN